MKVNGMLTRALALFVFFLPFCSYSYVKIESRGNKQVYDFVVDNIKFENKKVDDNHFVVATLEGVEGYSGINYELGSPEVPVIRFNVEANDFKDIKIITRQYLTEKSYQIEGQLKPVFDSVLKVAGARYQIVKNDHFFEAISYPQDTYIISPLGSVRGVKNFQVTLYPVQFLGSTNEIKITRSFQVEVKKNKISDVGSLEGILFVIGQKFTNAPSLKNYIAKKARSGFEVSQINAKNLNPDQIRLKIKELYSLKPNLKYVILIGDIADVPSKTSLLISGVTDHYYASIDTDDYTSDIATPDLYVGRISAASAEELGTILLKYSRYIDGDFSSRGWMGRASFLATNDRWQLAEATHNYVIDGYTAARGYTGTFPGATEAGGDKLYAITNHAETKEVMEAFLQGRSIIDYSGHGAETFWDSPRVSQVDVRSMTFSSLPFVISNACITGNFRIAESFAETWQRQEWGAVMFWGSMDSTYWDEDDILEKKMFDGIFRNANLAFGPITDFALIEMAKYYGGEGRSNYYFETYHMFGDPSIALRLK